MKKSAAVVILASMLSMSGLAHSQDLERGRVPQGTFRLHLDTTAINHTYDFTRERSEPFHFLWAGSHDAYFGLGFAVIDNLLLGARMRIGFTDRDPSKHDLDEHYGLHFGFRPYFEYLFFPLDWLSPFVTAQMGVDTDKNPDRTDWSFLVGGGGGVHFFAAPQFSIDLTGFLTYHVGKITTEDKKDGKDDDPHHKLSTALLFGLSGWL